MENIRPAVLKWAPNEIRHGQKRFECASAEKLNCKTTKGGPNTFYCSVSGELTWWFFTKGTDLLSHQVNFYPYSKSQKHKNLQTKTFW